MTHNRIRLAVLTAALAVTIPALALTALPAAVGDEAAAAPSGMPVFGTSTLVSASPMFEPSVQVDSTGVIYVAGAKGFPSVSPIYRSEDGGASWIRMPLPVLNSGMVGGLGLGAEPELSLAADDTLYYSELYVGNVILVKYVDHGRTLEGFTFLGQTTAGVDRQWIAVGEPNPVGNHEIWMNTLDVGRGVTQYYSPDALLVPTTKPRAVTSTGNLGGPSDPPAYDPVNKLTYTVYNENGDIWVARSSSDVFGLAGIAIPKFRIASTGDSANQFPVVAVDAAGNVYAAWSQPTSGGNFEVFAAASTDRGVTWSAPVQLSGGGLNVYPWMAAGGSGRIAVAWYHSDGTGNPETDVGPWRVEFAQGRDMTTATPEVARVTLPHVVQDGFGICLSGSGCTLSPSGSRALGDYFQVAIGPDGMAHIAYAAAVNGQNAKVYHVKQVGGEPT